MCAPDCCPLAGRSCCCACVVVLFLLFCAFQLKMRTAFWTTAIGLGLVLICSWHACSMAAPAASPPSSPAASTPHSFLTAAAPSAFPVAPTFSAAAPHLHLHSSTASSSPCTFTSCSIISRCCCSSFFFLCFH